LSRLLLVRHGDTAMNSAERYWGSTDVTLSASGITQAERLRDRLAPEEISTIYASDLCRASDTAKIVAARQRADVILCPELREMDFGEMEGLTYSEISRRYPEVARMWQQRSPLLKCPGGDSLESFNNRVIKFTDRLENHASEETLLIVAHSGTLRSLICHLLGIAAGQRWQFRLDLGSLSIMATYPEGAILSLLNDVSHLM